MAADELEALAERARAGIRHRTSTGRPLAGPADEDALTAACLAVEDALVDLRDARIQVMNRGHGFIVCEPDGRDGRVMRMGTRDGLRLAVEAYLAFQAAGS